MKFVPSKVNMVDAKSSWEMSWLREADKIMHGYRYKKFYFVSKLIYGFREFLKVIDSYLVKLKLYHTVITQYSIITKCI